MLGMSYFACVQYLVAAQQPPHLKAIFAHDGFTDWYRHNYYQGGMCNWGKAHHIWRLYDTHTTRTLSERQMQPEEFRRRLAALREDPAIRTYPYIWKLTNNAHNNPMVLDLLLNPFDGPFYWERSASRVFDRIKIPVFLLSRWSAWAIHLPGAIEAFEKLTVPRRMIITETPGKAASAAWGNRSGAALVRPLAEGHRQRRDGRSAGEDFREGRQSLARRAGMAAQAHAVGETVPARERQAGRHGTGAARAP
jgi:predicted acyl esterase